MGTFLMGILIGAIGVKVGTDIRKGSGSKLSELLKSKTKKK